MPCWAGRRCHPHAPLAPSQSAWVCFKPATQLRSFVLPPTSRATIKTAGADCVAEVRIGRVHDPLIADGRPRRNLIPAECAVLVVPDFDDETSDSLPLREIFA
jgi:hypothetical protein